METATQRSDEVYCVEGLPDMLKMLDFLPNVKSWPNDGIVPDLQYFKNSEELYKIIHHAPECSGCGYVGCEVIKGLIVHGIEHARAREQDTPVCINCLRSDKVFSIITRGRTTIHLPRVVPQTVVVKETDEPVREPVQILEFTPHSHTVSRRPLTRKRRSTCEDKCDGDDVCSPQISRIRTRQRKQKRHQLFPLSDEPTTTSTLSEFSETAERYDTKEFDEVGLPEGGDFLTFSSEIDTLDILTATSVNDDGTNTLDGEFNDHFLAMAVDEISPDDFDSFLVND